MKLEEAKKTTKKAVSNLAIYGGSKIRNSPLPSRGQFSPSELEAVKEVFKESWQGGVDFGYQGKFEELYTKKFCSFLGSPGYADAVSSGTAGLYVALSTLQLNEGDEVIIPPVTDPGAVSAVILNRLCPVLIDSDVGSFNMSPSEFKKAISPRTKAVMVAHIGGLPAEIDKICRIAESRNIKVIEDCSQSHGTLFDSKRVGTFGDIAVFSTMFSKNHSTGGCGAVVYTQNEEYYWNLRSRADKGKPFHNKEFDPKNPEEFLFPALNFNLSELSCAIGIATLKKLPKTISRRQDFISCLKKELAGNSKVCRGSSIPSGSSPFFYTIEIDKHKILISKDDFAEAVMAEGIAINPHYRYLVSEWPWAVKYLAKKDPTENAVEYRDKSFNLLFNENYGPQEIRDIVKAILKVESAFLKEK